MDCLVFHVNYSKNVSMYEKIDKFIAQYISFTLQLPPVASVLPPPVTITFNSYEIWEVRQNDNIDFQIYTSELGYSTTIPKYNGLSFSFNCNANYTAQTRQKILILTDYLRRGCAVSFTFYNYKSFVPNFPHNISYTPSGLTTQTVNLPYAAIKMTTTDIDSTADTKGVLTGENSIIEILVKEGVSPFMLAPCKQLSMSDFALAPFVLDFDGTGYYVYIVYVELATNGLIDYFLDHPVGTLQRISPPSVTTVPFTFVSIDPTNKIMIYTDDTLSYVSNGETYRVTIENIPVQLKTGERCEVTFTQDYTISI